MAVTLGLEQISAVLESVESQANDRGVRYDFATNPPPPEVVDAAIATVTQTSYGAADLATLRGLVATNATSTARSAGRFAEDRAVAGSGVSARRLAHSLRRGLESGDDSFYRMALVQLELDSPTGSATLDAAMEQLASGDLQVLNDLLALAAVGNVRVTGILRGVLLSDADYVNTLGFETFAAMAAYANSDALNELSERFYNDARYSHMLMRLTYESGEVSGEDTDSLSNRARVLLFYYLNDPSRADLTAIYPHRAWLDPKSRASLISILEITIHGNPNVRAFFYGLYRQMPFTTMMILTRANRGDAVARLAEKDPRANYYQLLIRLGIRLAETPPLGADLQPDPSAYRLDEPSMQDVEDRMRSHAVSGGPIRDALSDMQRARELMRAIDPSLADRAAERVLLSRTGALGSENRETMVDDIVADVVRARDAEPVRRVDGREVFRLREAERFKQ